MAGPGDEVDRHVQAGGRLVDDGAAGNMPAAETAPIAESFSALTHCHFFPQHMTVASVKVTYTLPLATAMPSYAGGAGSGMVESFCPSVVESTHSSPFGLPGALSVKPTKS